MSTDKIATARQRCSIGDKTMSKQKSVSKQQSDNRIIPREGSDQSKPGELTEQQLENVAGGVSDFTITKSTDATTPKLF
jgi:hypothetical protein